MTHVRRRTTRLAAFGAAMALTAGALLSAAAVAQDESAAPAEELDGTGVDIELIVKENINPFWVWMIQGAEARAAELGASLHACWGVTDPDPEGQTACIENAVSRGATTILIAPSNAGVTPAIEAMALAGGPRGRGGMLSKLRSIKIALDSGGLALIANGTRPGILARLFAGEEVGTLFLPGRRIPSRKRWLAYATAPAARVIVNAGARDALVRRRSSLLFAGVVRLEGDCKRGDAVSITDEAGREFARGIVNYSARDALPLLGKRSPEIAEIAGEDYEELITRDNIVVMD